MVAGAERNDIGGAKGKDSERGLYPLAEPEGKRRDETMRTHQPSSISSIFTISARLIPALTAAAVLCGSSPASAVPNVTNIYQQQINLDSDQIGDVAIIGKWSDTRDLRRWNANGQAIPVKSIQVWQGHRAVSGIKIVWMNNTVSLIGNTNGNDHSPALDISGAGLTKMIIGEGQDGQAVAQMIVTNKSEQNINVKRGKGKVGRRIPVNVGDGRLYGFRYSLTSEGKIAGLGAYCGKPQDAMPLKLLQYNLHLFKNSAADNVPGRFGDTLRYSDNARKRYVLTHEDVLSQDVVLFSELWAQEQRKEVSRYLERHGDFKNTHRPGNGSFYENTSGLLYASKLDQYPNIGAAGRATFLRYFAPLHEAIPFDILQLIPSITIDNFGRYIPQLYEILNEFTMDYLAAKGIAWVNVMAPYPLRIVYTHAPTGSNSLEGIKRALPAALDGYNGLVIFAGDLNIPYFENKTDIYDESVSDAYRELKIWLAEEYGLHDSFYEVNRASDYTTFPAENTMNLALHDKAGDRSRPQKTANKIDYIFFGGHAMHSGRPDAPSITLASIPGKQNPEIRHDFVLNESVSIPWAVDDTSLTASDHYPTFVRFEISANGGSNSAIE